MNPWLQVYFIIQSGVLNFFATIPGRRFFSQPSSLLNSCTELYKPFDIVLS